MFSRKLKIFIAIVLLVLAFPSSSYSGNFFDFFRVSPSSGTDSSSEGGSNAAGAKSDCGKQIETFKHFLRDGRICKQDDDCISMDSECPLGCKFYINKNFVQILDTEMGKVQEACSGSVCSYKCTKMNIRPVCVNNKCQARTK